MSAGPFDLDSYFDIPRVGSLAVSPDGRRVVLTVARRSSDGKRFVNALWEVATDGVQPPRRLTRSTQGESFAGFLPDGSALFTSSRPDADQAKDEPGEDERGRLWVLPAQGGEARVVAAPPGGIGALAAAREAGDVVWFGKRFAGKDSDDDDAGKEKARKDADLGAILYERYPVRWWDHWLGPRSTQLFAIDGVPGDESRPEVRSLVTDDEGQFEFSDPHVAVAADGAFAVTTWERHAGRARWHTTLVTIDLGTGERRALADDPAYDYGAPSISPDGRSVIAVRGDRGDPQRSRRDHLYLIDLASGDGEVVAADFQWHGTPVWTRDGSAVLAAVDRDGDTPVFRIEIDGQRGRITRLVAHGSYTHVSPADDGTVYALRSSISSPNEVVAFDATTTDQDPRTLPTPGLPLEVPGRVESVIATATDGAAVQSWLVLPKDASADEPAPLAVFVHGGPLMAWGAWTWRWNPQLLAQLGYAVLLPNPALSTGFGQDFIQRGWSRWGQEPYTDVLAAIDDAEARPDIDGSRTALLGASFGGYMANWVAGHTDRFSCIVTHASLWALESFHGTTDVGPWWEHELGDPYTDPSRYVENSPAESIANVRTPILVIHGERDVRVPIGEGVRLWTDLSRHGVEAKFLYFPDENHWILKPNNARVWYETVIAWLEHHVRGEPFKRPELL